MRTLFAKSMLFCTVALGLLAYGCGSDKGSPLGPSALPQTPGPAAQAAGQPRVGLSSSKKSEVEFKGKVESIAPPDLRVSGALVRTDATTEIRRDDRRIALTDIRVGEMVKVEGMLLADGAIQASEIEVDGGEVQFKGPVESVSPPDLRVKGFTVHTDGNTRITRDGRRITLTDIKPGETVEVEGLLLPDGSVQARRINVGKDDEDDEVEFRGVIQSISPPNLVVGGVKVVTDAKTEIERDERKITLNDLKLGEIVKVEGTLLPDGSVLADEIKAGDDDVEFTGTIQAISRSGLIVVNGINVVTDGRTRITKDCRAATLADLKVGDVVKVEGKLLPDGTVLARRIKAGQCSEDDEDSDDDSDDDDEDSDDDEEDSDEDGE